MEGGVEREAAFDFFVLPRDSKVASELHVTTYKRYGTRCLLPERRKSRDSKFFHLEEEIAFFGSHNDYLAAKAFALATFERTEMIQIGGKYNRR